MNQMVKPRQKTIGIDDGLWNNLDVWLRTEQAKNRGFHSKAQFANLAIGDYLSQYKDNIYTQAELIKQLNDSYRQLSERFERQLKFVDTLEQFWFRSNFPDIENSQGGKR